MGRRVIDYTINKKYNPFNKKPKPFKFIEYGYLGCPRCGKNVADKDCEIENEILPSRIKRFCANLSCEKLPKDDREIKFICFLCYKDDKVKRFIFCQENFHTHLRLVHKIIFKRKSPSTSKHVNKKSCYNRILLNNTIPNLDTLVKNYEESETMKKDFTTINDDLSKILNK
jgi:hypothetical protein